MTMTREFESLYILFSDISGSSSIYEQLGDRAAQEIIGRILTRLSDLTVEFDGKVIKTVGDAVIATFQSVDNAIEAAKSMQMAMICGICEKKDLPPINIHIGIHHGAVVIDDDDIFGDAVNIASRVADYAKPRQIVATRAVIEKLPKNSMHLKKYIGRITAKNISGEIELFEVLFGDQQTTMVIDSREISDALFCSSLYLLHGRRVISVDADRPVVSVGREDYNDIAIKYSWVSRTHAYLENRNGIFMVSDKSSNGTFIYPENAEPIYINQREHPLVGKGVIFIGREKSGEHENHDDVMDVIQYEVR